LPGRAETELTDIATLTEIVEPEAKALGFALVRVALFGSGDERTLQVMAERAETRQLTIDDCAALSRRISEKLDALEEAGKDPIEGAYRLEVSSPGIDRPLTRLKDFDDWSGHMARIALAEPQGGRKQFSGTIRGTGEGGIVHLTGKDGKDYPIPFSSISSAKLLLTDELIDATNPLSTEGADLIKTEG
jgi:ribosome maturation factor RimP